MPAHGGSREISVDSLKDGHPEECWLPIYNAAEVRRMQEDDAVTGQLLRWMEQSHLPSQHELFLAGEAVKHFWLSRDRLRIHSRILYYAWENLSGPHGLRLMLPRVLVSKVLEHHHDHKTGGHFYLEKTLSRVKTSYMWYRMQQDCLLYVRTCSTCSKNKKPNRKPRAALGRFSCWRPIGKSTFGYSRSFYPQFKRKPVCTCAG